jgi:hypothetical protein
MMSYSRQGTHTLVQPANDFKRKTPLITYATVAVASKSCITVVSLNVLIENHNSYIVLNVMR